ncbi:tRNA uridine-5-carboxymethylaminomethyl(34) synthesis GTPase MnmE [Pelagibacterium halotolerans]|uniref:tRNA uridine-5-carboxymethylaminomethyl(34) synthesis GTPase MnmE n=1 Tax=Pelagibacterium halotolerans TaxID=531813 RepID=UPI000894AD1B|nr:tRNA uridine-5-carboxymethylaminomethyl(34) synthesis GTPase MnmE [Pelagibacterium halotolerans]QJR17070.1 tRNA uridine-5-carboxymethylaminomethyl(34) synthesis GTPase MnmE [Pelagibacterium halotolerans]SEA63183.1 tRNA modification GTPase trmE [Pelagibacterium halotolerans]
MQTSKTIAALSTGSLPSGVAVIRLSGPTAFEAVERICGQLPKPRALALKTLKHPQTGEALDQGLVAVFPGPHSFTGEDCAEFQVHGSPAGVKAILSALTTHCDVALAGAGDFTRRAFENGKLDLTAVEGLGDLLAAETESQRRQALSRLEGGLADQIAVWRSLLLHARAEIEARLDFSDEDDVPFELPAHFVADLQTLAGALSAARATYDRGRIVREGFRIVLAGAPNAGKSSLLNRLAGSDVAIVTAEAGTTRDTKDVAIDLGGQYVTLTDTAGLRDTISLAEGEGIVRARKAMQAADLVLWLMAPGDAQPFPDMDRSVWRIGTKSDLDGAGPEVDLRLSALTGDGIETLLKRLESHIEGRLGASEASLVSHLRDRDALDAALGSVESALGRIEQPELCAEDLRRAADVLAALIGLMDNEAVLDRLFAGFCIGK